MPGFPETSAHAEAIRQATFEAFAARLREAVRDPEFAPLHLGDTYPLPPLAARRVDLDDPAVHRYGPVTGDPALREAGAADLARLGAEADPADVFVTPGATGGLDLALNATLLPGDEVLVLTPTWPLVFGLLQRRGAVPVEVDVDPDGWLPGEPEALVDRLEAARTPRTAAVSLCNPNNPSGFSYGALHLAAIEAFARDRGLWVYYDAVYADLAFDPAARPLAFVAGDARQRTFAVSSFSKTFGLAGQRVGLLLTPPGARHLLPRLLTHSTYHTSNLAQRMALASLRSPEAPAERALRLEMARRGARLTEERLPGLAVGRPEGGAFAFLDLRARAADEAETLALLSRCLDAGVSLTPGVAFGRSFARFARLCFTAVPPDRLEAGLLRLRGVLGFD